MQDFPMLKEHPLFSGLSYEEIERIRKCFRFVSRRYRRNEYILMEGDAVRQIGIILSGEILMEKEDVFGEGCFFIKLQQGELFGDMFIGEQIHYSTVNYRTLTECEVVWFQYRTLWGGRELKDCLFSDGGEQDTQNIGRHICDCHLKFIENLTGLLAVKTRRMLAKVEILSTPLLRQRILTCLRILGERKGSIAPDKKTYTVEVPFNKTELAEFLCVNRSALMRELSRMKEEGVLRCEGKRYIVCQEPERRK
ncbi:MAG: Crp/Fnr family transcriptional regulator [Lachnospiraceae bacterium]|nr:Crp/Fnr family transcriptional regulator [Lachnospiraceae bacterium]